MQPTLALISNLQLQLSQANADATATAAAKERKGKNIDVYEDEVTKELRKKPIGLKIPGRSSHPTDTCQTYL